MAKYDSILEFEGEKAAKKYLSRYGVDVEVDTYGNMKKSRKNNPASNPNGQVHHLSQDAAFNKNIKRNKGLCVELEGNAFKDQNSSHYKAHNSMEKFWDQYRKGGSNYRQRVKVTDYNKALYGSLVNSGMSSMNSAYATTRAIAQQKNMNIGKYVPRIPGKINQKR